MNSGTAASDHLLFISMSLAVSSVLLFVKLPIMKPIATVAKVTRMTWCFFFMMRDSPVFGIPAFVKGFDSPSSFLVMLPYFIVEYFDLDC